MVHEVSIEVEIFLRAKSIVNYSFCDLGTNSSSIDLFIQIFFPLFSISSFYFSSIRPQRDYKKKKPHFSATDNFINFCSLQKIAYSLKIMNFNYSAPYWVLRAQEFIENFHLKKKTNLA